MILFDTHSRYLFWYKHLNSGSNSAKYCFSLDVHRPTTSVHQLGSILSISLSSELASWYLPHPRSLKNHDAYKNHFPGYLDMCYTIALFLLELPTTYTKQSWKWFSVPRSFKLKQYSEISGRLKHPFSLTPIDRYSLGKFLFKISVGNDFTLARYAE